MHGANRSEVFKEFQQLKTVLEVLGGQLPPVWRTVIGMNRGGCFWMCFLALRVCFLGPLHMSCPRCDRLILVGKLLLNLQ